MQPVIFISLICISIYATDKCDSALHKMQKVQLQNNQPTYWELHIDKVLVSYVNWKQGETANIALSDAVWHTDMNSYY